MKFRPALMLLALGLAVPAMRTEVSAQDITPAPDAAHTRPPLFTATEMERFHAIAAARAAQRESYIRASDDDEIILLEPYIVEGENALLMARIRRSLERGALGRRRIFLGLTETARQDLMFARRSQDEFFRPGSVGRPNDAPNFDGIDLLALPAKLRPSNLRELFRAPAEKVGE